MALHDCVAFLRPSDEADQIFYPISEWCHTWPDNKHKSENSIVSQEPNLNLKISKKVQLRAKVPP